MEHKENSIFEKAREVLEKDNLEEKSIGVDFAYSDYTRLLFRIKKSKELKNLEKFIDEVTSNSASDSSLKAMAEGMANGLSAIIEAIDKAESDVSRIK